MKKIYLTSIIAMLSLTLFSQNTEDIEKPKATREEKKQLKTELHQEKKYNKELEKREKRERPKELITIMGNVNSHGGYFGLGLEYSEIGKVPALSFNANGSWVIGHSFAFGFGGSGFVSDYSMNHLIGENTSFQGGYGGIIFEPILLPRFPVHISLPLFLGAGGIAEMMDYTVYNDYESALYHSSSFLLLQPGAELELNFFKHFRLAFGAYYRYPATINFSNTSLRAEDVLEGLSMGVKFKLGKF